MYKLLLESQIQKRVAELGREITLHYNGLDSYRRSNDPLIVIGVLKGSLLFFSDLIRHLNLSIKIDFITAKTYYDTCVQPTQILYEPSLSINNRHVLLVDDILDTGKTLFYIYNNYVKPKVLDVKIVTLLKKKVAIPRKIKADWIGFSIPDKFVYGYGLDKSELDRNLVDIYGVR